MQIWMCTINHNNSSIFRWCQFSRTKKIIYCHEQGGIPSPVLFCLYINALLVALYKAGVRCFFGNNFVGALACAINIVLLAPSAFAHRKMLAICDNYATEYLLYNYTTDYYISFNSNNSKCSVVLPSCKCFMYNYLAVSIFYVEFVFFWICWFVFSFSTYNCHKWKVLYKLPVISK